VIVSTFHNANSGGGISVGDGNNDIAIGEAGFDSISDGGTSSQVLYSEHPVTDLPPEEAVVSVNETITTTESTAIVNPSSPVALQEVTNGVEVMASDIAGEVVRVATAEAERRNTTESRLVPNNDDDTGVVVDDDNDDDKPIIIETGTDADTGGSVVVDGVDGLAQPSEAESYEFDFDTIEPSQIEPEASLVSDPEMTVPIVEPEPEFTTTITTATTNTNNDVAPEVTALEPETQVEVPTTTCTVVAGTSTCTVVVGTST
jgi:hypothetical protein